MKRSTDAIEQDLLKQRDKTISAKDLLSSGSSLLNLACSGRAIGCFVKGKYYRFVGDSESGKTWLALSCLAEASINKNFDDYDLIYDNAEDGALMNIERFFGPKVVQRLRAPAYDKVTKEPRYSEQVEHFYYHVDDAIRRGKPFVYVLDSMDALDTKDDAKVFSKNKKASRKQDQDSAGSYGTSKAKINSSYLRRVLSGIRKTKSILIIIGQTRDNIGFGAQFNPDVVAGGRALKFYATLEIWSSVFKKLDKTVRGKKRKVGILSKVRIKKNRVTGRDRTITIPIYHSYGIDDIGSMISYLVAENHWDEKDGVIDATEFNQKVKMEKLIKHIESEGIEPDLRRLVENVWNEIEDACSLKRKARYS